MVSATDPKDCQSDFVDCSSYYFIQITPQFSSGVWVGSVPDLQLLWKTGSAGNRTRNPRSLTTSPQRWCWASLIICIKFGVSKLTAEEMSSPVNSNWWSITRHRNSDRHFTTEYWRLVGSMVIAICKGLEWTSRDIREGLSQGLHAGTEKTF
jgi:hypothetical protein